MKGIRKNMIEEIVKVNEQRIAKDINKINGIKCIDFIDIFLYLKIIE